MVGEKQRVEGYLATVDRLEPDIHMIDAGAFYASMAISARRQADAAEQQAAVITEYIAYLRARDGQRYAKFEDKLRRKGALPPENELDSERG